MKSWKVYTFSSFVRAGAEGGLSVAHSANRSPHISPLSAPSPLPFPLPFPHVKFSVTGTWTQRTWQPPTFPSQACQAEKATVTTCSCRDIPPCRGWQVQGWGSWYRSGKGLDWCASGRWLVDMIGGNWHEGHGKDTAGTLGIRPGELQVFWNCWNCGMARRFGTVDLTRMSHLSVPQ